MKPMAPLRGALDDRTKKALDESISTIVQKKIIAPFSP